MQNCFANLKNNGERSALRADEIPGLGSGNAPAMPSMTKMKSKGRIAIAGTLGYENSFCEENATTGWSDSCMSV